MSLIIKGAHYYDVDANEIVVPHMSGEFYIVDCDRYVLMDDLKDRYDEDYIRNVTENSMFHQYKGDNYYHSESSPVTVSDFTLLSDLSELSHTEEDFY